MRRQGPSTADSVRALRFTVLDVGPRTRLDRWLAGQVPDLSRARLQALIEAGRVRVGGTARKTSHRLVAGDVVDVEIPPPPAEALQPEAIALTVVYEDEAVLVVDKPAGMVVHPGAGHAVGTLAAAVLAHAPGIAGVGGPRRPGIVHRLDKDTSGLLVLAKTAAAYDALTAQLAARTVTRRYCAVVHGRLRKEAGVVDAPIGRDPRHRQRMAVVAAGKGKRAVTRWRVQERFPQHTSVEVELETGRTHQIRVHLASLGHPIVGDDVYGGHLAKAGKVVEGADAGYALHAQRLAFLHPSTQKRLEFTTPLPPRMQALLSRLRHKE